MELSLSIIGVFIQWTLARVCASWPGNLLTYSSQSSDDIYTPVIHPTSEATHERIRQHDRRVQVTIVAFRIEPIVLDMPLHLQSSTCDAQSPAASDSHHSTRIIGQIRHAEPSLWLCRIALNVHALARLLTCASTKRVENVNVILTNHPASAMLIMPIFLSDCAPASSYF